MGDTDGGERDFFFVDAPARSFNSPLFFSFFSFFLSSALPAGPGAAGPPRVPLPTSPLRCAALTLGGVMAAAAEVSGMRGRAPGAGGWWPCCGDTAG